MKNGITYIATGLFSMTVTVLICFAASGNIGQSTWGNTAFIYMVFIIVFLAWTITKKLIFLGVVTKNPVILISMAVIPLLVFWLLSARF